MTGEELQTLLQAMLSTELLEEVAGSSDLQQRARKLRVPTLLRTLIVASASPAGGRQADMLRHYIQASGLAVVRSSFHDWFTPPLEAALVGVSAHARRWASSTPADLAGALDVVDDWRIIDSTTVLLPPALRREYPGAGAYAAVKVHKTLSVGRGLLLDYHFSPARDHDSPHLVLDTSWKGIGLLADLGYASIARLAACQELGIAVIIRLKDRWRPTVHRVARADLKRTFVPDTDLELFLDDVHLGLRNPIDVDAEVGRRVTLRLVGVAAPRAGHRFYLTNLPRRIGPHQVADIYRVRWEIETNNKLDKSGHRLHEIAARRPATVRCLLHASLLGSMLVGAIVHAHNRATRPAAGHRLVPPLHHGLVARTLSIAASRIARAFALEGAAAQREWDSLAALVVHAGADPNWRSRPSILDQLRGWRAGPTTWPRLSSRARP